jgi:hypothetical protein
LRDFQDALRRVRSGRDRRLRALRHVAGHRGDFLGRELDAIMAHCGRYDSCSSRDFGDWTAQWRERDVLLSVYVQDGRCVDITLSGHGH